MPGLLQVSVTYRAVRRRTLLQSGEYTAESKAKLKEVEGLYQRPTREKMMMMARLLVGRENACDTGLI